MRNSSKTSKSSKRGRPRSFDEDEALAKIADVFWRRGFAATSLDELSNQSGVGRPSLYSTFGDKESMYLRSIQQFMQRVGAALDNPQESTAADRLRAVFDKLIGIYAEPGGEATGCLVLCTAPAEADSHLEVRQALNEVLAHIDKSFASRLVDAQESGELAADADVEALGALLASTAHSIALRARAGVDAETLRALASSAIRTVLA